jgi:hypothetical protein
MRAACAEISKMIRSLHAACCLLTCVGFVVTAANGSTSTLPKNTRPKGEADERPLAHPDRAPALSHEELCTLLVDVARAHELPVGFFANLLWQESKFNHRVVSRAGAQGVAQFMPQTARMFGLENPFDAREALPASGRFLRMLVEQFGNLGLAAAAYNAGPRRVIAWRDKRGQLPKETLDYVRIITGRPAADWAGTMAPAVVFRVPPAVPCHHVEEFAQIEQTERALMEAKAAEEPPIVHTASIRSIKVAIAPATVRARKTKHAAKFRQVRRVEASAAKRKSAQWMRGRGSKLAEIRSSSRKYSAQRLPTRSRAAYRS